MQIDTTRFGQIDIPEEAVIRFPQGLYGLESIEEYCLLPHPGDAPLYWLQAVTAPHVALMVTDPFHFCPGYEVEIPDPATDILSAAESSEVSVYTTVSVTRDQGGVYTNLLGPVVINHEARRGMQIVLDGSKYTTRYPIVPEMDQREEAA